MGVETLESELAHVSVETEGNNSLLHKENGKSNQELGIKFGSHGTDEPSKKEVNNLPENNFPKDAADEWPAPKQVHTVYMVKYRVYEDQKVKAKVDLAEKELKRLNQARFQIIDKLKAQKADKNQLIGQLKSIGEEARQFWSIIDEKRKEMEPLHQALVKLRSSNTGGKERSFICSSEEELNDVIKSLQYRIQHESIPLSEEKQIIREIKQLEGTRDKVIAKAAVRAKIEDSLGEKEAIQDQVKLIGDGLDGVWKEQKVVKAKRTQLNDEIDGIQKLINGLKKELEILEDKQNKAFEKIKELRKQLNEGNASFNQNRSSLNEAKDLAINKNVEGLKELVDTEVDKFISLWSSSKAFRDDYERRILPSLDMRQLSRDGRMRNPDEKPLVVQEPPTPSEVEIAAKPNPNQVKEDSSTSTVQKVLKEKSTKQQKEASNKVTGPESIVEESLVKDREAIFELEKPEEIPLPKKNEVDEVKLKELKREEEMAKAEQALKRKKKLAEKAAAKAAIKAQKEAEKKLKDREKKARKKAEAEPSSAIPEEPTELADEVMEPEESDGIVEAAVPSKTKKRKGKTVGQRGKAKGPDSLPKIILKRKKSTNYWVWAAPVALLVVLLLAIGYYYLI